MATLHRNLETDDHVGATRSHTNVSSEVQTEHLLLGLLGESASVGALVLKDLSITSEIVRPEVDLISASSQQVLSSSEVEEIGSHFQVLDELVRQIETQLLLKLRGQTDKPRVRFLPQALTNHKDKSDVRLSPQAKRVLELAAKEARHLQHNYIGTEHLLLGLLHDQETTAAKTLLKLKVTVDQVRARILTHLGPDAPPISAP